MNISKHALSSIQCNEYSKFKICEEDYSNLPRPFFTFAYVINGKLECVSGDRIVEVYPGEIFFVPYRMKYKLRWTDQKNNTICALHFNCKEFTEPFGNKTFLLQKISGHPELYADFAYLRDHIHNTADVLKVFSVLYGLCDKLYSLLDYGGIIHIDERIQHAVDYINENYRWHIDIDELATLSNLSVSRFHHCFKEQTGMTPIEYKNNLCIKYAITQLVGNEKKSIEEISAESGFESSTYFRRVFKSIMKRTPREYRQVANSSML